MSASSSHGPRPNRARTQRDGVGRVAPSRRIALEVISAVRTDDAYANLLLPARLTSARLSEADAALATELTYGTLRMSGFYDEVIARASGRDLERIDPPVLDVLRLGAHQLLSMRIATHAAVNESVLLAKRVAPAASGFVNAVLRGISRTSVEAWRRQLAEQATDDDARRAVLTSHPEWIIRAVRGALEREGRGDELDDLLAADNAAPRVNLALLPGVSDVSVDELGSANVYSPIGLTSRHPFDLVAEHSGVVRVQDEGSQLAALALSRVRPVREGERWLDMCAGPGGKTAVLAAEALAGRAHLTAGEIVPARAELVRRAIACVPLEVAVQVGDGRELDPARAGAPDGFDRILLDAPCTGLGALRRRPEARWRKLPSDVAELTRLQRKLFDAAFAALAPDGILAYVTCSPHTAETHGVVNAALERWGIDAERVDTHAVLQSVSRHPLDLAGSPESAQLWPHRHGTDAMFITLIRRRAGEPLR